MSSKLYFSAVIFLYSQKCFQYLEKTTVKRQYVAQTKFSRNRLKCFCHYSKG